MKKKELLKMRNLVATDKMLRVARKDTGKTENVRSMYSTYKRTRYRYCMFFRAVVENEILKVAVFPRAWLTKGITRPQFEIYISKAENTFITYEPDRAAWRTAKIDMLKIDGFGYGIFDKSNFECGDSRKVVNDYLETGKLSVKNAVLDFQCNVRKENIQRKHRNEIEQIDSVMSEVPNLPKDFDSWIEKNCFEEYLMYEKKGKKYKVFCTHCGKWVNVKDKPTHNASGICPDCKTSAIYKSWNKQKYLYQEVYVGILQRLQDDTAYILRGFKFRATRCREKGWDKVEIYRWEDTRVTLDERFRQSEFFEYGEYKYTGITRWCHEVRHGMGYYYHHFGRAVMYTSNLKRVLSKEKFAKCNLKEMFLGGKREYVDPIVRLQVLKNYPYLEYLQKSGLNRLVQEILGRKERPGLFNGYALKVHDALKLNKQNFQRLRKVDGNCNVLEVLQWVQHQNEKISDESLILVRDYGIKLEYLQVDRTKLTVERALNLINSQAKKMEMILRDTWNAYKDYLDMAERRGMDITDEIVCKNNRMMEYHDRYLEEENRKQNQKRDAEVDKKFKKIEEDYEKNELHFKFETEDYFIIAPRRASDITNEGRFQHHCVGASDAYLSKMTKGTSYILFLRKKDMPERPYYTLEVQYDGNILQKRSMYNRQPNIEKITEVLGVWTKEIEKRCLMEQQAAV